MSFADVFMEQVALPRAVIHRVVTTLQLVLGKVNFSFLFPLVLFVAAPRHAPCMTTVHKCAV